MSAVPDATGRIVVDDVVALRAMAHPERLAILKALMSDGPRTATECAALVDLSPSACSYHLRQLERFGFVVRDDTTARHDGRTRPWRAAAIGFAFGPSLVRSLDAPESRAVVTALWHADRVENERLARRFAATVDAFTPRWQAASTFSTYELAVTPDELSELRARIDELLVPYRAGARTNRPADALPVHVVLDAFPRADPP